MTQRTADQYREALEGMCEQFAYPTIYRRRPCLTAGGLSALEDAFEVLGWSDPHPVPEAACDIAGCPEHATCGFPYGRTEAKLKRGRERRYLRTCGKHMREYAGETPETNQ